MTDPDIAILLVNYNGWDDLAECLPSVLASDDGPLRKEVVVVDNASTDGSPEKIRQHFPEVTLLESGGNLGFAGGNNVGWEHIRTCWPGVRYLALLNADTVVESGWLVPLVERLQAEPATGIVQAKLRLHPERDKLNSAGNVCQFLGFGHVRATGEVDRGQYDQRRELAFASGAASLVRGDLLRHWGLFEDDMFLYMEDMDLSWKLRQAGFAAVFEPRSIVYHKYHFGKNYRFYFYFERNRWRLLLTYYKAATLVLLAPALAVMEAGQLYFATRKGILGQKLRSMLWFLRPRNLARTLATRRLAQRRRAISDRRFTELFCGAIEFPHLREGLLTKVANPFFRRYWALARRAMRW